MRSEPRLGSPALADVVARADHAQQRDIAILFVDLVGSTELARSMGAEASHRLLSAFLEHCASCISQADGHVARFMGDGVLAYFGYPRVREDDANRAVSAAIAIREGCARLGAAVQTRAGIASGGVILGAPIGMDEAREVPVFGDVANLAFRLQAAAAPGEILVATGVAERAGERFSFRQSPPLVLKGFPEVDRGWEVLGLRNPGRERVRTGAPEGPLIGRQDEYATLVAAWQAALKGDGGALLVKGQPGVGKTRLVGELVDQLPCDTAVHMVSTDSLRMQAPLDYVTRLNAQVSPDAPELVPSREPDAQADDAARADAIAAVIVEAIPEPSLIILEDLHWADPSSREVLDALAGRVDGRSVLLIATARPDGGGTFGNAWRQILLGPLDQRRTAELVGALAGQDWSATDVQHVVGRSGGIPLFARELVRHLSDNAQKPGFRLVPKTLIGVLLARLTSLGPAMPLAQCAAVLGVEAPIPTIAALANRRGIDLATGLDALAREGIATVSGSPPILRFTHALFREAALDTLLSEQRRVLHHQVAEILEAQEADVPDAVLAEFWERAGEQEKALRALMRAVAAAQRQRAWPEVRRLTDWGLALLHSVSPEHRSVRRELELRNLQTEALQITTGYSSAETRNAAAEAQRTARRAGEIYQAMLGSAGQWMAASSAGDYRRAQVIAAESLSLARLHGGADALAAGHMIDMTTRYRMGDLTGAEASFVAGGDHFAAEPFVTRAGAIAQTFGNAALVALFLGDSAAARRRCAHALRVSRRQSGSYDRCFAAYMVAMVEILLGADRRAAELSELALRLATSLGFPQFTATAHIVLGRARAGCGDVISGMGLLREGLGEMAGTQAKNAQTLYLTWYAEAALAAGNLDAAAEAAASALAINPDERFYRPETLRIRALALAGQGSTSEAASVLEQGLALAGAMEGAWFLDRMRPLAKRLGIG